MLCVSFGRARRQERALFGSSSSNTSSTIWFSLVDLVYHLAAHVGVKYVVADPLVAIKTNLTGTEVVSSATSEGFEILAN